MVIVLAVNRKKRVEELVRVLADAGGLGVEKWSYIYSDAHIVIASEAKQSDARVSPRTSS